MTVLAFKTTAGRDLILGKILNAMQADNPSHVTAHTFDLIKNHAKDREIVQPFILAAEYLHENGQPLNALKAACWAIRFANPGSPLMEAATNIIENALDHTAIYETRNAMEDTAEALLYAVKDQNAFNAISEKFCEITATANDLHRDFALQTLQTVISGMILPHDYDGDIADLYFEDADQFEEGELESIDQTLPPCYLDALVRLANQYTPYDQDKAYSIYEIIVAGFSEDAFEGLFIPEKIHHIASNAEKNGNIQLAVSASNLLFECGEQLTPEMEKAASELLERNILMINDTPLDRDATPVPLQDFLKACNDQTSGATNQDDRLYKKKHRTNP